MKVSVLAIVLILASCSRKESFKLIQGPKGDTGADGHSLVSQYVESDECLDGGTRLDIFLDVDDSMTVTEGDLARGSLLACNGSQGIQGLQGETGERGRQGPRGIQGRVGPQGLAGQSGTNGNDGEDGAIGPQGIQGIAGPSGSQGIQGIQGESGINATASISVTLSGCRAILGTDYYSKDDRIYNNTSCSSSHSGMVADLNGGNSFWVASNKLAVDFTSSSIKIITFN
jgi:hypothetical protein